MSIPTLNIGTLQLKAGNHRPDSGEACLLEAVSFVAGEPWSDRPQCVSQVLGVYAVSYTHLTLPTSDLV